jgi:hypothetical protein
MRASVLQRTGEDWTNVKLALSTAELHRRAEVPELKALRIGRRQPPPARSGWREPPPGLDELFAGYDAAGPAPLPPPPPLPLEQPEGQERRQEASSGVMKDELYSESEMTPPARVAKPRPEPVPEASHAPPSPPMGMAVPAPKSGSIIGRLGGAPRPASPVMAPMRSAARGGGGLMRAKKEVSRNRLMEEGGFEDGEAPSMDLDEEEPTQGGYGGAAPAEQEPQEARLELGGNLLDYDSLELPPADQPGRRGKLQPRPVYTSHELIALTAVHVQVDIVSLLAVRQQSMESVYSVTPPTWAVPPRQSTPYFDYRYDVETRMDVPSDGVWHTVSVFSAPVGLTAEYLCVPSIEPQVFRTVKVENRTPHALLAGPVDVTLGDEFLMTSPLPTLAPGATQRLGLGVEESIKVSRNTRFDEASGGVFGGATTLTHHVSVEVANRLGRPATVEIRERVPVVPKDEKDIKVEEAEIKPAWRAPTVLPGDTPVEGERAWRVTVQPGEKQSLDATWVVRIPSSKMLQGGNRRT